jgi:hypothetical protein
MAVKITFSPMNELVIHEIVEVSKEDLMRERITPSGNMPLYWCAGILFSFSSLPMSEEVIRDYLRGRVHWMEIHYARMKEYQPIINIEDNDYKTTMSIRIIDTTKSELHKKVAKWIISL